MLNERGKNFRKKYFQQAIQKFCNRSKERISARIETQECKRMTLCDCADIDEDPKKTVTVCIDIKIL